jgi:hypothetical protein
VKALWWKELTDTPQHGALQTYCRNGEFDMTEGKLKEFSSFKFCSVPGTMPYILQILFQLIFPMAYY